MLNRTPKASAKKTKSALNSTYHLFIGFLLILFLCLFQQVALQPHSRFNLEIADTPQARAQGLSGRQSLPENSGMLFVFDSPSKQCMWMKNMKFPLDMVWLDKDKRVIQTRSDIKPETFPASFCADSTKYVVELNSGDVQREKIKTGQRLKF